MTLEDTISCLQAYLDGDIHIQNIREILESTLHYLRVAQRKPNLKWEIYDRDKAKEAKLKLINIDTETTLLEINLCEIPQQWTIDDFLTHTIEDGIVFMERT